MRPGSLTRRRVLGALAAAGLGGAPNFALAEERSARHLHRVFSDFEAVREIAQPLAASDARRARARRLGRTLEGASLKDAARFLEHSIERDFAAGRIDLVHGWIFAETETSCLVLALLLDEEDHVS